MKFILTRHAVTDWNDVGRIQGHTDIPINSKGKEDARKMGEILLPLGVELIVSSDLKRSKETAEIIQAILNVPMDIRRGLRECFFGSIQGLTKDEAIEKYGLSVREHLENQTAYDFGKFGGERTLDVLARHKEVLEYVAKAHPTKTVLLVGHGRGLNTLLVHLGYEANLKRGEYREISW